ncbi:hypothetical protein [Pseudonocardia spinosispora]|uniref:hypothetical protein n=1 Tax=Pseudonocardia spinosispora TaxID=103441 RepID=UPI0004135298|nr:hypothetical protein [Pseudonocardia spinosispora]
MLVAALAAAGMAVGAATAIAAPGPTVLCSVTDPRLAELSGLATDGGDRRWAIVDSGPRVRVYELAGDCSVRRVLTGSVDPLDVEDLARSADGTFWLADTGDNNRDRATVAMIELTAAGTARLHRMRYPDGPHDAEAVLMEKPGLPLIVTKEPFGPAGIYRPDRSLSAPGGGAATRPAAPVDLLKVGEVVLPRSETVGGPVGGVGTRTITGGATTADGKLAALRTYTDAWLFAASDGDLLAALGRTPTQVPLPGEPQGEAIAFTGRGTLLSGSESRDGVTGRLRTVAVPAGSTVDGDSDTSAGNTPRSAEGPSRVLHRAALFSGVAVVLTVGVLAARAMVSRRRSGSRRR